MILSIWYSSSVPISSGRSCGKLRPCSRVSISLYKDRREAWNISWIFHCFGSFSRKVMEDMTWVISKRPVCLAESFLEGTWSLRFLVSSQTLSPTFQDLKWEKVHSLICCCANMLLCQFVGSFSFLLYILNLIELLLESWKEGLSKGWIGSWFISHN